MSDPSYVCKLTSELSQKEWDDFIITHNGGTEVSTEENEYFENLYKRNIYGDSIHVIVYLDGVPLATNGHLRNDLEEDQRAYQSLHTYVSPKLRGKGVFLKMSRLCCEKSDNSIIYGFPNSNSAPGFKKMRWKILNDDISSLYCGLNFSYFLISLQLSYIPDSYAMWRFQRTGFYTVKSGGDFYLVKLKERSSINLYIVIGKISGEIEGEFKRVNPILLFNYGPGKGFFKVTGTSNTLISKDKYLDAPKDIPLWRSDGV